MGATLRRVASCRGVPEELAVSGGLRLARRVLLQGHMACRAKAPVADIFKSVEPAAAGAQSIGGAFR
jgi:hypothetical protein